MSKVLEISLWIGISVSEFMMVFQVLLGDLPEDFLRLSVLTSSSETEEVSAEGHPVMDPRMLYQVLILF